MDFEAGSVCCNVDTGGVLGLLRVVVSSLAIEDEEPWFE